MIDRQTGIISLRDGSIVVNPSTSKKEFENSSLGKRSKLLIRNEPWKSFNLPRFLFPDKKAFVSVFFYGDALHNVTVAFSLDLNAKTWADWSLEKEMRNKAFHDALLEQDLGEPPYEYPWGKVVSVYSEITEESIIVVTYASSTQ